LKFVKRKDSIFEKLKAITWKEIKEWEATGEKEIQFELSDILEEASIYGGKLEDKLEENIEFVLNREKIFGKGWDVVIPPTALNWECEEGMCWYHADFEVFDETMRNIIARGTATGSMIPVGPEEERESVMEIADMSVFMPIEDVKKLKELAQKRCKETLGIEVKKNEVKEVYPLGGNTWVVTFYPTSPIEETMGGKVYHVKAKTREEAISKALRKFKRGEVI
jgi:hypothetical protein